MTRQNINLLQKLLDEFFRLHGISEYENEVHQFISLMIDEVLSQIHNAKDI